MSSKGGTEQSNLELIKSVDMPTELAIVVLDLSGIEHSEQHNLIRDIKLAWSSGSLIVTGESNDVSHALAPQIQPLIYRAFKKPVSVKQLALSLEPAMGFYKASKQSETLVTSSPVRSNDTSGSGRSIVLLGFGLAAVGLGAWYFLSNQSPSASDTESGFVETSSEGSTLEGTNSVLETADKDLDSSDILGSTQPENDIDLTIDLGELALADNRLIAPSKDNAVHFFDLALSQDPYNTRAYSGSKQLAQALLAAYPNLIREGKYAQAYAHLDAYQKLAPLDRELDLHLDKARAMISTHYQQLRDSNNAPVLALATREYEWIGGRLSNNASLDSIRENEERAIRAIQSALTSGSLLPPTTPNAYALLTEAVSKKAIVRSDYERLLAELENLLIK